VLGLYPPDYLERNEWLRVSGELLGV